MEPKFVNGLRVTDEDTMEVAEMVLNKVNKELVSMIESLGVQGVGYQRKGRRPFEGEPEIIGRPGYRLCGKRSRR